MSSPKNSLSHLIKESAVTKAMSKTTEIPSAMSQLTGVSAALEAMSKTTEISSAMSQLTGVSAALEAMSKTTEISSAMSQLTGVSAAIKAMSRLEGISAAMKAAFLPSTLTNLQLGGTIGKAFENLQGMANSLNVLDKIQANLIPNKLAFAESLAGVTPNIRISGLSLTIGEHEFHQEDIAEICDEYLFSDKGLLTGTYEQVKSIWKQLPLQIKILLYILITFYLPPFFDAATKDTAIDPDRVSQQIVRTIKQQFTSLTTSSPQSKPEIFVKRWKEVKVYSRAKRKSRVTGKLPFLQDVTILQYRKKKRWLLVEWEDENGNTQQGWVIGRYIYR